MVRVASIDAPETGQGFWRVARTRLRQLTGDGTLVDCYKVDRYGRQVCHVKTAAGVDVAAAMLTEGLAWYPERFADEDNVDQRANYRRLQAEAQDRHSGLWEAQEPMAPWDCRRVRLQREKCR